MSSEAGEENANVRDNSLHDDLSDNSQSLLNDQGFDTDNSTGSRLKACFKPPYDILVAPIRVCLLAFHVIGLGPLSTQVGDEIWVICDARTPFILHLGHNTTAVVQADAANGQMDVVCRHSKDGERIELAACDLLCEI